MFISSSIAHQTSTLIPVALGNLLTGSISGWLAPTLQIYRNSDGDFPLTDADCSLMVSLQFVGAVVGTLLTSALVDRVGRNLTISAAAIIMTASWTGTVLTKNIPLHLLLRTASGISCGLSFVTTPIYVGEICSAHARAIFGSVSVAFYFGGMEMACALATYCTYETTAQVMLGVSLLNVASLALLREPAHYLLTQGRVAEAENRFFWLRGRGDGVKREFDDIRAQMGSDKEADVGIFSADFVRDPRIRISTILTLLVFLTGAFILNTFVSITLASTDNFTPNELTILNIFAQCAGSAASPFVVDRFRRRTLWMTSAVLCLLSHLATALLYHCHETAGVEIPGYAWFLFGSLTAYSLVFSALLYPLCIVARAELLPQKFKAAGTSLTICMNALVSAVIGQIFLPVATGFGMKTNFVGFGVCAAALLAYSCAAVPETKGMTLTDIEKLFGKCEKNDNAD